MWMSDDDPRADDPRVTCDECGAVWFTDEETRCPRCTALPQMGDVVDELRSRIAVLDPHEAKAVPGAW